MRTRTAFRTLAGIVLAWYVLFLGASVASATAGSGNGPFTMVCSADGSIKWVPTGHDEGGASLHAGMDCPLCAGTALPPPPGELPAFTAMCAGMSPGGHLRRCLPAAPPHHPPPSERFCGCTARHPAGMWLDKRLTA